MSGCCSSFRALTKRCASTARHGCRTIRSFLPAAAVNGREPRLVILVTVREAFLHCGKALKRSKLWHGDYRVEKKSFPSLGRIIVEQTKTPRLTVEEADAVVEDGYRNKLY